MKDYKPPVPPKSKVKKLAVLAAITRKLKKSKRKIVMANGCFDLLHSGHVKYLESARLKGDLLIVAMNSDASVRRLKGPGRPLLKVRERVALISAFSCVDYVTIFNGSTVKQVLRTIQPDIHAKGGDYTVETVPERDVVLSYGGRVVIAGGRKIQSTRDLIKQIKLL